MIPLKHDLLLFLRSKRTMRIIRLLAIQQQQQQQQPYFKRPVPDWEERQEWNSSKERLDGHPSPYILVERWCTPEQPITNIALRIITRRYIWIIFFYYCEENPTFFLVVLNNPHHHQHYRCRHRWKEAAAVTIAAVTVPTRITTVVNTTRGNDRRQHDVRHLVKTLDRGSTT